MLETYDDNNRLIAKMIKGSEFYGIFENGIDGYVIRHCDVDIGTVSDYDNVLITIDRNTYDIEHGKPKGVDVFCKKDNILIRRKQISDYIYSKLKGAKKNDR